jgi:hypothetical protein
MKSAQVKWEFTAGGSERRASTPSSTENRVREPTRENMEGMAGETNAEGPDELPVFSLRT